MNGILLLDKSLQMTSNSALQKVKRLFGIKKAGHTGSLDPLATGMLPICFGEATKFSQFLLESDKYYRVIAHLGIKTTTGDAEGEIIQSRPVSAMSSERLENLFQQFIGEIQQIPPMYSAIKLNGQPLYALARKGINVERKPRIIKIHSLKLIDLKETQFEMEVHCSKGTYIRTLIEDMGDQLGCGAFVSYLRRIAVSPYQNERMYSLDDLSHHLEKDSISLQKLLLPIETAVKRLPSVKLTTSAAYYFRTGQSVTISGHTPQGYISVFEENDKFIGIGVVEDDGLRLSPKRLLSSAAMH